MKKVEMRVESKVCVVSITGNQSRHGLSMNVIAMKYFTVIFFKSFLVVRRLYLLELGNTKECIRPTVEFF